MPSNNASPAPENPVIPKAQESPWYIRHFIKLLIGFGLGGGAVAILLPLLLWLHCGMSSGSSDQLRLHLLYVTGGIIAVLTLLQTNWKNQGDRLKIDADIKKNEQDAKNEAAKREQDAVKSERDHIRQVHAERRGRYTKAVEQLADEKAAVRLGGIYTLVGLVDEWLADDSFKEESDRHKEGQVIVNSLCSYIRSPFPSAAKIEEYEARKELEELERNGPENLNTAGSLRLKILQTRFNESDEYKNPEDITTDYTKLHEEQDVRRAIFEEMSRRCSKVSMNKSMEVTVTPGAWSGFKFDFSRAPIFYPLNDLTIEQGNFASTGFYGEADFQGARFVRDAYFTDVEFTGNAFFGGAKFAQNAYFKNAKFARDAFFGSAKFTRNADFKNANFTGNALFRNAKFARDAYFLGAKFTRNAHFPDAKFTENVHFGDAKFTKNVHFGDAKFTENAYFLEAKFTGNVCFNGAYFEKYAPTFAEASSAARFSAQVDSQDYVFSVRKGSKPINCGTATLDGKSFEIPLGAVLCDPASWDEEEQDYTRLSEPAQ